jgi:hypothetical protein
VTTQQPTQVTSCCNPLASAVSCFSHSKCKCFFFFYKCNDCSLLNITWHLVLVWFAIMSLVSNFPVLLRKQIDSVSSGEPFPSYRKRAREKLFRSTSGVMWWLCGWIHTSPYAMNIPTLNSFLFQYNLFLTNRMCFRSGLRDFSIILYLLTIHACALWNITRKNWLEVEGSVWEVTLLTFSLKEKISYRFVA